MLEHLSPTNDSFDTAAGGHSRATDEATVALELRPTEPVLLFSPSTLSLRAREFLTGFPGTVSYAVKANTSPSVLRTLVRAGVTTFDVASPAEIAAVRAIDPAAVLNYHNPVKAREEVAEAYRAFGVRRFAADHVREVEKIVAVAGGNPEVEVAIRFCLPKDGSAVQDFSTKFGATPDEAAGLLRQVSAAGLGSVLTFHPGSQCLEPGAYRRHIQAAAGIIARSGTAVRRLNVGGGFPAHYAGMNVPPLSNYFEAIAAACQSAFPRGTAPLLECEPGRSLVAESVSILTRANLVKPERAEVFLSAGIYGGLMEVTQSPSLQPPHRAIRPDGKFARACREFIAYGPTCDPLDRLPHTLRLPADFAEGDYVVFGSLGAYGSALFTRFNGYGRANTLVVGAPLA